MITKTTIDQVRELDILEVIGRYITVKSRGNTHTACCPFHNEKTPSFTVNQRRGIFKCFGCGASGNNIAFVMAFNNISFPDAVKEIAHNHGISVEYENFTPDQQAEYEKEYQQRKSISIVMEYACTWFEGNEIPKDFVKFRKLNPDTVKKFRIGYAPAGKDNFFQFATKAGHSAEVLLKAGLIFKSEKGNYYDFFQNRVMFPITNQRGEVVAFSGRLND